MEMTINDRPYKVYTALLSQSGENNPVAIILENSIGVITWAYDESGSYIGGSVDLFTTNKTAVFPPPLCSGFVNNQGEVYIKTPNDGFLDKAVVKIRVYNS